MEHMFKKFLSVAALLSVVAIQADNLTYFRARPQSFNGARKVSNEVGKTHKYDEDSWYGNFSIAPGYERSFRASKIAHCLFGDALVGNKDCRTLLVQGSELATRDPKALLADYFYLPTDYSSTLSFDPQVSNGFIDFNFYLGLSEWWTGGYLRLYAPFVHTKWNLKMKEDLVNTGTQPHVAGYFTPAAMPRSAMLAQATNFFAGEAPDNFGGVTFNSLCFSKIRASDCSDKCNKKSGSRTRNGFGEIRAELGWDFWQDEDYHLGIALLTAAPTGNRPKAQFLFDAVVGNGKSWELGAGSTGHYTFWRGADDRRHFSINYDLSVLHLFGSRQERAFDLAAKPLSRYALASRFRAATANDTLAGDAPLPDGNKANFIFDNEYSPVANLTTQDVKVSVGAQVDFVAWFNYTCGGFSGDFGYNLWYSSCEKFSCSDDKCPTRCCDVTFAPNQWALKGDAQMFGFGNNSTAANPVPVNLSASDSEATIFSGTAQTPGDTRNDGVDNAQPAYNNTGLLNATPNADISIASIDTSIQTEFITQSDLDAAIAAAPRNRGLSNKVFGHLAYTWDRNGWVPYLGLGASGEFGSGGNGDDDCKPAKTNANCPKKCDDNCVNCALSMWSIWLKTGFSF